MFKKEIIFCGFILIVYAIKFELPIYIKRFSNISTPKFSENESILALSRKISIKEIDDYSLSILPYINIKTEKKIIETKELQSYSDYSYLCQDNYDNKGRSKKTPKICEYIDFNTED